MYLENIDKTKQTLTKELINWYKVELTYSSNALEGNTLTRNETALVIEKGITSGGKTLKEHLEATNHAYAFDYMLLLAQNSQKITLENLYTLHNLIIRDIDTKNSDVLRKKHIRITGTSNEFPDPLRIPELMEEFFSWLYQSNEHPVIKAAHAHFKLLNMYPFAYENAKTARLLMNALLIKAGYLPIAIQPDQRDAYCDAIARAQQGNFDAFNTFILTSLENAELVLQGACKLPEHDMQQTEMAHEEAALQ